MSRLPVHNQNCRWSQRLQLPSNSNDSSWRGRCGSVKWPVPGAVEYLQCLFYNDVGEGAGWGWIWRWRLLIIDVIMFRLEGGRGKKKTERVRRKKRESKPGEWTERTEWTGWATDGSGQWGIARCQSVWSGPQVWLVWLVKSQYANIQGRGLESSRRGSAGGVEKVGEAGEQNSTTETGELQSCFVELGGMDGMTQF